jgi:hypothetical protein
MKLLAYTTVTKSRKVVDVLPQNVKTAIPALFLDGYNRILAKWNNKMFVLEKIEDQSKIHYNGEEIMYTKTEIEYHPYAHLI